MDEESALIKKTIHYYLSMPKLIDELTEELNAVSDNFYASRSFTGSSFIADIDINEYQRSISPERGAMLIVDEEQGIKKRINRLSRRYNALAHQLGHNQLKQLRRDVRRYNLTELEQIAYKVIQSVEETDVKTQDEHKKQSRLMRLINSKKSTSKIVIEVPS